MTEKRRGLGRGLGSLIPSAPEGSPRGGDRPVDVFFGDREDTPGGTPEPAGPDGSGGSAADRDADVVDIRRGSEVAGSGDIDGLVPVPGAHFAEIPVDQISPNPKQPRQVFDEDEMAELVHSIREIGVLQPVVVRPIL